MECKALGIAAKMLIFDEKYVGYLHYDLAATIVRADGMVQRCGGILVSRQAIVAIIVAWCQAHPTEAAYDMA